MKYECIICNYTTERKSSYDRHNKSARHTYNSNNQIISKTTPLRPHYDPNSAKIATLSNICSYCGKYYTYTRGLTRHMKSCSSKNELLVKYNEISSKYSDISSKYDELQDHNMQLVDKYEELVDKYGVKCETVESDLIKMIKHNSTNPNVYSFVLDKFNKTKPLVPIKEEDVPALSFLKVILSKKNGKMELCDELQHHVLHKTLKVFFGDFYVDSYKKDDKTTQQFFSTDCARLNYVVRSIVDGSPGWERDNKGLIISEYLITPILKYIRNHLSKYTQKYLDYAFKSAKSGIDKVYAVEKIHRFLDITKQIDSGSLNTGILKYISPHFKLDKTYIEKHTTDLNKYIKHRNKSNEISKITKTSKTSNINLHLLVILPPYLSVLLFVPSFKN